ncbi:MAG: STAS domain-containing protein [Vicinamibacterales bacterium]
MATARTIADIVSTNRGEILQNWLIDLRRVIADSRISDTEVTAQATEFLNLTAAAIQSGTDIHTAAWQPVRTMLEHLSRSRAVQGFSSSETATFVNSLKKPVFEQVRRAWSDDPDGLAQATWTATELIDALGMMTIKAFQQSREAVIIRQQEDLLELSTPVVKLWDGVLALPMIGTLDSQRTQVVMEALLQRIVETGSEVAIIDITGVPTVDTLVAQHLLKTVTAIRLMGADCIISGIRPQIAQTIVHLGVELRGVTTKASLADALAVALERSGLAVVPIATAKA